MSVFIVTTDAKLSELEEHNLLKDKDIIRIIASSYLVRNCNSVTEVIIKMVSQEKCTDISHLRPWFAFQVSKPWYGVGAEQSYKLTYQKVAVFLKSFPEGNSAQVEIENKLLNLSDDELDKLAEQEDFDIF